MLVSLFYHEDVLCLKCRFMCRGSFLLLVLCSFFCYLFLFLVLSVFLCFFRSCVIGSSCLCSFVFFCFFLLSSFLFMFFSPSVVLSLCVFSLLFLHMFASLCILILWYTYVPFSSFHNTCFHCLSSFAETCWNLFFSRAIFFGGIPLSSPLDCCLFASAFRFFCSVVLLLCFFVNLCRCYKTGCARGLKCEPKENRICNNMQQPHINSARWCPVWQCIPGGPVLHRRRLHSPDWCCLNAPRHSGHRILPIGVKGDGGNLGNWL